MTETIQEILHRLRGPRVAECEVEIDERVAFEDGRAPGLGFFTLHEELEKIFGHPVDLLTFRSVEQNENYLRRRDVLESFQTIYVA